MENEKRLIDANALKDGLSNLEATGGHKYYRQGMNDVLNKFMPSFIDEQPTVDAVEVVRCKDCKWYQIRKWDDEKPQYDCRKTHALLDVKQDDFCSYGERRTDGN